MQAADKVKHHFKYSKSEQPEDDLSPYLMMQTDVPFKQKEDDEDD